MTGTVTKEILLQKAEKLKAARSVYLSCIANGDGLYDPFYEISEADYKASKNSYQSSYEAASPEVQREASRTAALAVGRSIY